MKTTDVSFADLSGSVIAVPPLARRDDRTVNRPANATLIRHIESGGVSTLMYGGNANFYHMPLGEYAETLDFLAETAGPRTWLLPSAGPDYGRLMDQAAILRARQFPAAMILPTGSPATPDGVARAARLFAEAIGRKVVLYIKSENYLTVPLVRSLVEDGLVTSIKYAIVRSDPAKDEFLVRLVDAVDRRFVVSGIGERPVIAHFERFGLSSFTSGSVSVAPALSSAILTALKAGRMEEAARLREHFLPLEDLRDGINPIRALHAAVTLAGIADMGPILPMLSDVTGDEAARIKDAATRLLAQDRALARRAA